MWRRSGPGIIVRREKARPRRIAAGFTIPELMVVVVVVGVLAGLAIGALRTRRPGALSLARKIVSEVEDMRVRAVASRRWQQLLVDENAIFHREAVTIGMTRPVDDADWQEVTTIAAGQEARVCGAEAVIRTVAADASCPGSLPLAFEIAPDGAGASPFTVYVHDRDSGANAYRVTLYRATAMPLLLAGH
jgi:prepilin-type N-terminal cleavage/methylation domain-containing protein